MGARCSHDRALHAWCGRLMLMVKIEPADAFASPAQSLKVWKSVSFLFYSSGVITTSTLLPALKSSRAKAAIDSGVWALTICS